METCKYSNSKFLGYNYLRDRQVVKCDPLIFEIEKGLNDINFNEIDFLNSCLEFYKLFKEKHDTQYKQFGYELIFETSQLRYGFVHYDDKWAGWTTTHPEEHLFLHLDRYETEEEFIKRKSKTKRTIEEQLLHKTQIHLKEIEDAKEQLLKLTPDQLKRVLDGIKND